MPNYWPGQQQQQWPGSSSCSVRECCWSVAASGNVAGAGSGALQRTGALQGHPGALQRTGALQGQERPNGHQAGQSARILVKLTRRIALLGHLPECQITGLGSSSCQEAAVAASGSVAGALMWPGSSSCRGRNDQMVTKRVNLPES